uniref:CTF18, chromosome transmission fidelity factor 18 homolog (S. cerevisiae) n=1 Tax=Poecilia reticulata TaxID=8081 RepID=A0A3P9MT44_POERE
MDEYDELFEIEDQFEEQFADELEVLAQMEGESLNYNQNVPSQDDNITPPSSPEHYEPSNTFRYQNVISTPAVLDISGLAEIPGTPRRPITSPPPSRCVLRRPPLEGDFISVTDSSGNRVYLRQKGEADTKTVNSRILPNSHGALGLLALPVRVLREQEAERVSQSVQLCEAIKLLNDAFTDSGNTEDQENEDPPGAEGQTSQLWVERFSPRHYTELLSDDFTNRCLLKWLKLWDNVVFGRERKSRPVRSDRQSANQIPFKLNQGSQNPNRFKSKMEMTEEILEDELDQYKRPKYRVALLSGPPGLGKTTLAHVIAKHAGYNVVEINASDDRSAEVFQKRIDAATQMKSVLGANERPNCLIIDEIDGAPAAAINILLSVLNRKDTHGGDTGTEAAKKKKKKESVLLRPIICICNDL